MDLQEQLHVQMKKNQEGTVVAADNSNVHISGRQSDPSGGISAFRGGASMDGTQDHGVPTDKFVVGDSASEIMKSQEKPNDDLQIMYDRIVGATSATSAIQNDRNARQSEFMRDHFMRDQHTMSHDNNRSVSQGEGTLIHNPTINQQIRNRHIVRNQFGQPVGKEYKQTFVPANRAASKNNIKNDAFTMHETSYNATRERAIEDHIDNKSKILHGEFLCSRAFDNN